MAGFVRRYGFFPGVEVLTQIEGAVIIDAAPPGAVTGVGVGTVAIVGEFADMQYGVQVDGTGLVTTKPRPVEIFSSQDLLNKLGGFDETLGEFGVSGGNGFAALRNKRFSRLAAVPVNLASSRGVRVWRKLATSKSGTDPNPVVPIQGATVLAGREFKSGVNRVRIATRVNFTALGQFVQRTDGSVTAGVPAVTRPFTSAGATFTSSVRPDGTIGVKEGDLLVVGQIGGAGGLGANADTYRVVTVDTDTQLTVEKMDGVSFDWTTAATLPFRVHVGTDGDPGGVSSLNDAVGYNIPARPLDATIAASTTLTPTIVPPAATQTTWDPLSNLQARSTTDAGGVVFTAALQAPNAVASASFQTAYATAIDALLTDESPGRDVNIVWAARLDSVTRAKLKSHVLDASSKGVGRMAVVAPAINVVSIDTVIGDADPGVGAARDERVIYDWPGAQHFVQEAVGFSIKNALGTFLTDGILDDRSDGWMASVLSLLPPENNPGQSGPPVDEVLAPILGFQRGVSGLGISEYTSLRQKGVAGLRMDRTAGPIFQSGITTSLTSGQKNIARRRMADFIEDSLSDRYNQFSKKLMTTALKDAVVGETVAFLLSLLNEDNPPAQRIAAFQVDSKSGNTPATLAAGIFVVISRVQTLASADVIVAQAEIGENVRITTT